MRGVGSKRMRMHSCCIYLILTTAQRSQHCHPILWTRKLRFIKVKQYAHGILCTKHLNILTFLLPSVWQHLRGRSCVFTSVQRIPDWAHGSTPWMFLNLHCDTTGRWQSWTVMQPDPIALILPHSPPFQQTASFSFYQSFRASSPPPTPNTFPLSRPPSNPC